MKLVFLTFRLSPTLRSGLAPCFGRINVFGLFEYILAVYLDLYLFRMKRGRNNGRQQAPKVRRKQTYVRTQAVAYRRPASRTTDLPRSGELKFHDVDINDAVIATGGVIHNGGTINIIPQGVTEVQRIGRKCTVRSVHWKYRVDLPEVTAVATPNTIDEVRVIMYMDRQANGAAAAATDILETATIRSFRNLANSGRFVILMDRLHVINWGTLASSVATEVQQAEVVREYSFNKKCEIPLEFSAAAGTIDEIRSNNLGILTVGLNGTAGLLSSFRLRFSDN